MSQRRIVFIIAAGILTIFVSVLLVKLAKKEEKVFKLIPMERPAKRYSDVAGTEVGTGWSVGEDPNDTVIEAVNMALGDKNDKIPDFAIIFASSGSDTKAIFSKARELLGNETKIYGGSSDSRALMTDRGFVHVKKMEPEATERPNALAVMTVTSHDIIFGVGSANFSDYPSVQTASRHAFESAIRSAGRSLDEKPKLVLVIPSFGAAEDVLQGIEDVASNNTVILGGTSGGPEFAVIGQNEVYGNGVSVAVAYTDLPVGWVFEGGFDVTDDCSGIVTKVDGYTIIEIDHRPALDVYDECLGGKMSQLVNELKDLRAIKDHLTLHPFYRKYVTSSGQNYLVFSHPSTKDKTLKDRRLMTSTRIAAGERIYLAHGTWEVLLNRIGNLPLKAKVQGGLDLHTKPIFGIGHICSGVMGIIPEDDRGNMSTLINYATDNIPFIVNFTWGEQGHLPGIGNKHGNLLTSFVMVGQKGNN